MRSMAATPGSPWFSSWCECRGEAPLDEGATARDRKHRGPKRLRKKKRSSKKAAAAHFSDGEEEVSAQDVDLRG